MCYLDTAIYQGIQKQEKPMNEVALHFLTVPEFNKNKPLVTGLEWEDPEHVNQLSAPEQRRLCLVLTQIAVLINKRKLVLRPYFQDYELVRT